MFCQIQLGVLSNSNKLLSGCFVKFKWCFAKLNGHFVKFNKRLSNSKKWSHLVQTSCIYVALMWGGKMNEWRIWRMDICQIQLIIFSNWKDDFQIQQIFLSNSRILIIIGQQCLQSWQLNQLLETNLNMDQ